MSSEPTLHSGRLVLRPPLPADADVVVALLRNDRHAVEQTAAIPWPVTRESTLAWIHMTAPPGMLRWSVLLRPDGPLIGTAGGTLTEDALSIGYWTGHAYRRSGYTRGAVECVIDHARALGKRAVTAEVFLGNVPSANLLRGLGFRVTGEVTRTYPVRGRTIPTFQFALTL